MGFHVVCDNMTAPNFYASFMAAQWLERQADTKNANWIHILLLNVQEIEKEKKSKEGMTKYKKTMQQTWEDKIEDEKQQEIKQEKRNKRCKNRWAVKNTIFLLFCQYFITFLQIGFDWAADTVATNSLEAAGRFQKRGGQGIGTFRLLGPGPESAILMFQD